MRTLSGVRVHWEKNQSESKPRIASIFTKGECVTFYPNLTLLCWMSGMCSPSAFTIYACELQQEWMSYLCLFYSWAHVNLCPCVSVYDWKWVAFSLRWRNWVTCEQQSRIILIKLKIPHCVFPLAVNYHPNGVKCTDKVITVFLKITTVVISASKKNILSFDWHTSSM